MNVRSDAEGMDLLVGSVPGVPASQQALPAVQRNEAGPKRTLCDAH